MTFTPKAWLNAPSVTTPLNAEALIDLETRLSAYTDASVGGTTTVGSFNAKGDARRVTDGAIATGTNQLSSVSASFTGADIGKVVEVIGAGPGVGGNLGGEGYSLAAYIGSVVAGVANLVTTSGGSTPANAGTTVTGAIVTFGTDDTAAILAASTALSAAGGGILNFSPTKTYWFSRLVPQSNVFYEGNWATFYAMPLPTDGVNFNPAIWTGLGTPTLVQNITFHRMNWVGHGFEAHGQYPFSISNGKNVGVYECAFSKFCLDALYLTNITTARVVNNNFVDVCSTPPPGGSGTGNPLNLTLSTGSDTFPLTDLYIAGNSITGVVSEGIDITTGSFINPPQTVPFRARIIGNYIKSGRVAPVYERGIFLELTNGGAPTFPAEEVVISGNICVGCYIETQIPTLNLSTATAHIAITGNGIYDLPDTTRAGIIYRGSYATISGNVVEAALGLLVTNLGSSGAGVPSVTGDINSTTTVANVAGTISSVVKNGSYVNGTGIPSNTYIVSGAGTATWILSKAATATTVGITISVVDPAYGVTVTGNTFHQIAGASGGFQNCQFLNAMAGVFANNTLIADSGIGSYPGLVLIGCSWMNVQGNMVENPTQYGIVLRASHDVTCNDNVVHNPGTSAIAINELVGTANVLDGNTLVDDRAAHVMPSGITSSVGGFVAGANLRIRNNTISGNTANAVDNLGGQFVGVIEYRGNSSNPHGAVTVSVPASTVAVASQPYDRTFYVTAGASTVTMAIQNGPSPVIPASAFAAIRVPAGKTVTPTYANAPTWVTEGE